MYVYIYIDIYVATIAILLDACDAEPYSMEIYKTLCVCIYLYICIYPNIHMFLYACIYSHRIGLCVTSIQQYGYSGYIYIYIYIYIHIYIDICIVPTIRGCVREMERQQCVFVVVIVCVCVCVCVCVYLLVSEGAISRPLINVQKDQVSSTHLKCAFCDNIPPQD